MQCYFSLYFTCYIGGFTVVSSGLNLENLSEERSRTHMMNSDQCLVFVFSQLSVFHEQHWSAVSEHVQWICSLAVMLHTVQDHEFHLFHRNLFTFKHNLTPVVQSSTLFLQMNSQTLHILLDVCYYCQNTMSENDLIHSIHYCKIYLWQY